MEVFSLDILACSHVTLQFGAQPVLSDLTFGLPERKRLAVMGPSGSGKSTLLRLFNQLISPTSGNILYRGKSVDAYPPQTLRCEVAYVPQKPYLFGKTVAEDLAYPLELQKQKSDVAELEKLLDALALPSSILQKSPQQLSGGEQQRVALLRSLLVRPKALLLDEPTSALDEANTLRVEALLKDLAEEKDLAWLWVTHQAEQASRIGELLLYLKAGRLLRLGRTNDVLAEVKSND